MDSFYGGRPGVSFIIKRSFPSIADMIAAFKLGEGYRDVWYGEHAIIDSINKNDKDNGKIYRRGLNYQDVNGGAEYIAQIVGPEGGNPFFEFNSLEDVVQKAKDTVKGEKRYPKEGHSAESPNISINGDGSDIGIFGISAADSLVPGEEDGIYNDNIRYTWVNLRNDVGGESWFYVGFEIPYLVLDFKSHRNSSYDDTGSYNESAATITRVDGKQHPFYEQWDIGIPNGIKGDSLRNLRVIIPTAKDIIYSLENLNYDGDTFKIGQPGYDGQDEDIAGSKAIVVFDYYIFDEKKNGSFITVYLADYNIVNGIDLQDNGTVVFSYTHDDDTTFIKKLKWITSVLLDPKTGKFTIEYNTNDTSEWQLDWIDRIYIDESTGEISIHHVQESKNSTLNSAGVNAEIFDAKLKLIVKAELADNGEISFITNTGEIIKLTDSSGEVYKQKLINDIKLETDIAADKHIQVKYNDADYVPIGDPINYIQDMVVRAYDWHLLVLYSDPSHRVSSSTDGWVNNITGTDGTEYGSDIYWQDLGAIKDQSGLLVGFNLNSTDIGETDIVDYLNKTYPNGLTGDANIPGGASTKGKIVTYADNDNNKKSFYAYNYATNKWYYLGDIDASAGKNDARLMYNNLDKDNIVNNLNTDGILISAKDITGAADAIPRYWSSDYIWN